MRLVLMWIVVMMMGCSGIKPKVTTDVTGESVFNQAPPQAALDFANAARVQELSQQQPGAYLLGPGDILDISVWNRPEISRKGIVVAPDGNISLPRVGVVNVKGATVGDATEQIKDRLVRNYESPEVAISISRFNNNKAFVLGRVVKPGVVHFPGEGTLLEALALAGGLPFIGKETFLTRCAIIRGRNTVIWIDLSDLLDRGNMGLNARILNNDVIFIPEAEDEMIMVLGEVDKPGPIQLKRGLNLIDAVARAGGITRRANLRKVFILRPDGPKATVVNVDLKAILEDGAMALNYELRNNDIVYVSPTGIQNFNYALEQLMPSLRVMSITTGIADSLGLTNRNLIQTTVEDKNDE